MLEIVPNIAISGLIHSALNCVKIALRLRRMVVYNLTKSYRSNMPIYM